MKLEDEIKITLRVLESVLELQYDFMDDATDYESIFKSRIYKIQSTIEMVKDWRDCSGD